MNQRSQVQQFDRPGHEHQLFRIVGASLVGAQLPGQQRNRGPDALAASLRNVIEERTQMPDFGRGKGAQLLVNQGQLGLNRGVDGRRALVESVRH